MIWIGGFVLAVLLYIIGPDRFFDSVINTLDSIGFSFRAFVATLGAQAFGVIRAAAIALYVVFAVLAFLSAQRHHRGIGALIGVSIVFLLLVWRPYSEFPAPIGSWFAALVLVFAAAAVMTQRLLVPPPMRHNGPPPPFPPGRMP
ncbi:MAG TPA: hypothetical protein VHO91_05345 [Rhodopila sp.]|nr:hypothetical protein [Rhodopila sp.]